MSQNGMRAIHPGEILKKEYLEPLGISVNTLATALNLPVLLLEDIVLERHDLTTDTAMRLARFFDTTPQLWMNLQLEYELRTPQSESTKGC